MRVLLYSLAVLFISIAPSYADCTNPAGVTSEIRYNGNYDVFQGCTERGWIAFHEPDTSGGDPCETGAIGTVCTSDGAVYAGTVGGARMYVATADESGTYEWGGYGVDENGNNSSAVPELNDDGFANTNWLVNDSGEDHPAAQACRNRGADWYLPSIYGLYALRDNWAQLAAANLPTGSGTWYWTSSEDGPEGAWAGRGTTYNSIKKDVLRLVRCVRR